MINMRKWSIWENDQYEKMIHMRKWLIKKWSIWENDSYEKMIILRKWFLWSLWLLSIKVSWNKPKNKRKT